MNPKLKSKLERRKKLQQQVAEEKARNAGLPSPVASSTVEKQSSVIYSTHFMIEVQGVEDDEDMHAVYRLSDLVSTAVADGDTPEPVHVFDSLLDASNFVAIMDKIVGKSEPESVGIELTPTLPIEDKVQ